MARRTFVQDSDGEPVINADFVEGREEACDKVARFCENISDSTEIEGDVTLELSQLGMGSTLPIQHWVYSQGDDHVQVAEMIVDRAIEDGTAIGHGNVKYVLTIQGHKGRCGFTLTYPEREDDDIDEPPNQKGIVAQQMRHNESIMRMFTTMVDSTTKTMRQQLAEANARVRNFESTQIEQIKVYAELYDQRAKQQMEEKKLLASEARKDEVAGVLMQGLPVLLNKFLGPKLAAAGGIPATGAPPAPLVAEPNPVESMMQGFLSTITPEQLHALMNAGVFRQDQIFGFLEIFKAVNERIQARMGPGQRAVQEANQASAEQGPPPGIVRDVKEDGR